MAGELGSGRRAVWGLLGHEKRQASGWGSDLGGVGTWGCLICGLGTEWGVGEGLGSDLGGWLGTHCSVISFRVSFLSFLEAFRECLRTCHLLPHSLVLPLQLPSLTQHREGGCSVPQGNVTLGHADVTLQKAMKENEKGL